MAGIVAVEIPGRQWYNGRMEGESIIAVGPTGLGTITAFRYEKMAGGFKPGVFIWIRCDVPKDDEIARVMSRLDSDSTVEEAKILFGMAGLTVVEVDIGGFAPVIADEVMDLIVAACERKS